MTISGTEPRPPADLGDGEWLVPVAFKRLPEGEGLPMPAYQSRHAAGVDLHAATPDAEPVTLAPGDIARIPCGFAIAIPVGFEAQIRPRSGLAVKHGVTAPNTPGTIDADYRGPIQVPLINLGPEPFVVTRGMRIAQMVLQRVPRIAWREVEQLPPTDRGEGGFGHTGI